jgi:serine/threonine protein phosphatase PrpC
VALSEDHKPENRGERNRIEAAGGFVEDNRVNGSLNLSRSLGDFTYKQCATKPYNEQMVIVVPEIRTVERMPGKDQFLILACDGIWDCMSSEECVENFRKKLTNRDLNNSKCTAQCVENLFDEICAHDIL